MKYIRDKKNNFLADMSSDIAVISTARSFESGALEIAFISSVLFLNRQNS